MLAVKHYRQQRAFTCGPACVRSVLAYYGKRVPEKRLIEELGASSEHGTAPEKLAAFFRKAGFVCHANGRVGLTKLRRITGTLGQPCIVAFQDWGCCPQADLSTSYDHGHYAVVIGIDAEFVYLCDPSSKKKVRKIERATFLSRWRDIDASGRVFIRWALTVRPKH